MTRAALYILAALMLTACSQGESHYADFSQHGWAYNDTVMCAAEVTAPTPGTVQVIVRHDDDYPFANLWLELTHTLPGDSVVRRDTLNVHLSDAYGHWQGRGIGGSYQYTSQPVAVTLRPGSQVSLRHIMRVDTVPNIHQIGMVFKSEE